jgi:hypothetical protein
MDCLFLERVVQELHVSRWHGDLQLLPHALPFPLYLRKRGYYDLAGRIWRRAIGHR